MATLGVRMSLSVQVGLLLAVATALTSIVSFLYKHRGAIEAPAVDFRRPVHSSLVLFRSGWYTLGIVIAMASWGLHASALALAPISLVQSVIAGGLVMLTVIADKVFGLSVSRREWIGVGLAAAGLAFLAATLEGAGDSAHADFEPLTIGLYIAATASPAPPAGCSGAPRTSRSRARAVASIRGSGCSFIPLRWSSSPPPWSVCWSPRRACSWARRCR